MAEPGTESAPRPVPGTDLVPVDDAAVALEHLRVGSKSFHAASLLLPRAVRGPAAALYAFCRVADDVVDEAPDRAAAEAGLVRLGARLDALYAGRPEPDPVDRGFARVVAEFGIPRAVPDLLLDGFRWDVTGRTYATLDDTVGYGVRVASTVGVMMTLIMGRRDRATLSRAAELGVAMQLTNIARDVGEDARNGRLYLPGDWLAEVGLSASQLVAGAAFSSEVGLVTARLLARAEGFYTRANTGIGRLPWRCRAAIAAASHIYRDIGRVIAARGHDSVSGRAVTGGGRKVWLGVRALRYAVWPATLDRAEPEGPVAELVDAVAPR